jgi:hypothetical protein
LGGKAILGDIGMNKTLIIFGAVLSTLLVTGGLLALQASQANYDEGKDPTFELPDPLLFEGGGEVRDSAAWRTRRSEISKLFEQSVYGRTPKLSVRQRHVVKSVEAEALEGKATRKIVTLYFEREDKKLEVDLLVYLPRTAPRPVPVFAGLNFYGNHTIHSDPEIPLPRSWVRNNENFGITENRATDASRGIRTSRWPVEQILDRGYGVATIYYGDIDPDFDDGFQNGVHPLFYGAGKNRPAPDEWGSIGAWSWGLSRAMDVFDKDPDIDHHRIAVMGHSRLGKASLWAGAQDERFALVVSNNSGCGGAALSMRQFGETVERINSAFPHWFCFNFKKYNSRENQLPVDQHMLLALIAPRPVYVASAKEDRWADPKGEFLSALHASSVYELLGKTGLGVTEMPSLEAPAMGTVGYHVRSGGHDVTLYDWERFMDFADLHFMGSPPGTIQQ